MSPHVLVIQHVPWEHPGLLGDVLRDRGIALDPINIVGGSNAGIAPLHGCHGLILMGGPMGALDFDRYPGLVAERDLVVYAVARGIPVFGICLGHQIIATALDAALHRDSAYEVGLGTVNVVNSGLLGDAGELLPALHWHRDTVDLPRGATLLASTESTPNQAFVIAGKVFSTQFHLEVDASLLAEWLTNSEMRSELSKAAEPALRAAFPIEEERLRRTGFPLFSAFADAVETAFNDSNQFPAEVRLIHP